MSKKEEPNFNYIKDPDFKFVIEFKNNFADKITTTNSIGKNVTTDCALVVKGNISVVSFYDVLLEGCYVKSDANFYAYSTNDITTRSAYKTKGDFFYIQTNEALEFIAKSGFSISAFGLGNYADVSIPLQKQDKLVIFHHGDVNIYTTHVEDFLSDAIKFMGIGEVNIYSSVLDSN